MAHSFVMAVASELDAFRAYAETNPDQCVLLVDTYDTLQGVRHAIEVARELRARSHELRGIRLDSGDLAELSRQARAMLDGAGFESVQIVSSGGLDEYRIEDLLARGAPIDSFGVGAALGAPNDAPTLEIVYKLVAYEGRPVAKRSPGKETFPAARQVWREIDAGRARCDRIGLADEKPPADGERRALLHDPDVEVSLQEARAHHAHWLAELPEACRRNRAPEEFPVLVTPVLEKLIEKTRAEAS
jgi:nicotinate phosphoribosyltransferase